MHGWAHGFRDSWRGYVPVLPRRYGRQRQCPSPVFCQPARTILEPVPDADVRDMATEDSRCSFKGVGPELCGGTTNGDIYP